MIIQHAAHKPQIDPTAYVAPSATICGNVKVGQHVSILHGASVIAEGGSIEIGDYSVIMENAVVRSTESNPLVIQDHCLVGPQAHVVGCTLESCVFIATGAAIFHGAVIGAGAEVRIHGVVHANSRLPENTTVPIHWVAVGNPARLFSPDQHEEIWAIQKTLGFARTAYGIEPFGDHGALTRQITERYSRIFKEHKDDQIISTG